MAYAIIKQLNLELADLTTDKEKAEVRDEMADPEIDQIPPPRFNGPDNLLIIPTFHLVH